MEAHGVWYGVWGGEFLCEAARRRGAGAEGRVFGAEGEGVQLWAFWLLEFGIFRKRPRGATGNNGSGDTRDAQSPGRENAQWPGRGRFWCAVLATFASHGYTGVMKSEREVGVGLWVRPRGVTRYGRRSKRRLSTARKRNGPDAAKVRSR